MGIFLKDKKAPSSQKFGTSIFLNVLKFFKLGDSPAL
jgi:hypothetical protein